jgi:hypothetical protein
MANASSILYQAGQAVKNKIATELANISTGATGYTQTIGDNSTTSIDVTHSLNSNNLLYSIRDVSTNEFVQTETVIVDADTIRFVFDTAPTTNQYYVTVIGTDGTPGASPTVPAPTIGGGLSLSNTTGGLVWKGTAGITASRVAEGKFRLTFPTAYSAVSDYHVMTSFQDWGSPTSHITVGVERATTHVDFYTLRTSDGNNVEQGDITVLIYEFS